MSVMRNAQSRSWSLGGIAGAVLLGLLLVASPPATRVVRSRFAGQRPSAAVEPGTAEASP